MKRILLTLLCLSVIGCSKTREPEKTVDVLLIGAGVMSATLGTYLHELQPDWSFEIYERLDRVAGESSNGWNNAGTGHSAFCELNYTPETADGGIDISKAIAINESFEISKQFWATQVERQVLSKPKSFINITPHMSFVWGDDNVEYLRGQASATLRCSTATCSAVWSSPRITRRSPSGCRWSCKVVTRSRRSRRRAWPSVPTSTSARSPVSWSTR
jgi:malate dehydrogenase (quinone)